MIIRRVTWYLPNHRHLHRTLVRLASGGGSMTDRSAELAKTGEELAATTNK
jgi:hypothetical protein